MKLHYQCDLPTNNEEGGLWEYIMKWAARVGKPVDTWDLDGWKPAGELVSIGDGLEQWANATDAANFFGEFLWGDGGDHIAELEMFRGMSRHWRDRDKAAAFVAVQQEITEDIQRQLDEDWEAEHGWKYGPSGDKFWEEEEQEMLGLA